MPCLRNAVLLCLRQGSHSPSSQYAEGLGWTVHALRLTRATHRAAGWHWRTARYPQYAEVSGGRFAQLPRGLVRAGAGAGRGSGEPPYR